MKKLVLCLLALTPAFALAAPGPYATLQAGVNMVNADNAFQNSTLGFVGGGAVGYLFGDNTINYGLEADGLVYPNSNSSKDIGTGHDYQSSYDGYNISLLAVLKYTSCSTGLTAFVKGGGAYVNQQLTVGYQSSHQSVQEASDIAPELAGGVGYMIMPNLETDITWDHVFAEDQSNSDWINGRFNAVNNDNVLLGLTYHFA